MNTYDLQRAIRDDSSLNAGEVAVLFVLSTYLPHAAPSVAARHHAQARGGADDRTPR